LAEAPAQPWKVRLKFQGPAPLRGAARAVAGVDQQIAEGRMGAGVGRGQGGHPAIEADGGGELVLLRVEIGRPAQEAWISVGRSLGFGRRGRQHEIKKE
jgi:hypothetical protein